MRSYPCRVVRVVDGDTVQVVADLGFRVSAAVDVRIVGINAPEVATADGAKARDWAVTWVGTPAGKWPFTLECHGPDKYGGRWLGDLIKPGGARWSADAIAAGAARAWNGRGVKP